MTTGSRPITEGMLFTDQYQLTMAQTYFREGLHERQVQFDYFFRSYPDYGRHQAGYCVLAGLGPLLEWMERTAATPDDLASLRAQRTAAGRPAFSSEFLEWFESEGHFLEVELHAVPEGRVVHPHVPLAVATGPLAMTQILETSLLNHLNYSTLVATKASRVHEAGRGRPVLDFGMRRGPAFGANAGSRAALVGGADFSSNVGVSHVMGVAPKGTHAHSLVQVFLADGAGELEAFRAFAAAYPDDCTLLVDTVDTLDSGIPNAIVVFRELRAAGHEPAGIRLDSGDLAYLAVQAARMLDAAGFPEVSIVLSSDLDELAIWQIISQIEAEAGRHALDAAAIVDRLVYGVGTRLITSHGDAALNGVYKLVALESDERWLPAIKISENPEKIPIPGAKRVWRVYDDRGLATADVVGTTEDGLAAGAELELHHPTSEGRTRTLAAATVSGVEALLQPAFAGGARRDGAPDLAAIRARRAADLERLDVGVRRLVNPHVYHVSLTTAMRDRRQAMIADLATRR